MSDSSFAILDDSMAFLYDTIKQEDSDFYAALIRDAHRFHEIICQMFGTSRVPTEPLLSCTSERLVLFLPFRRNHCCLLCTAAPDNPDACSTALILRDLCDPLLSTRIKPASSKNMSFQLLFSRLMSENGDSDETLLMMLHNLAIPAKKHMRLILIRSELSPEGDESISLDHLLRPVSVLFSGANIAVMPAEIVVLLSSDTMYCPLPVSIPEFEQMLEENRALAMIGNPFTTVMAMRVTCRQCQRIFPIAMAVKLADEGRCMTFARYTQYNVIDICARSINAILGGSDIVILTHPGVVALTRYDRANGTNLRDVMFYYLMNDRSIAKTSAQLFMHRNTTIYKIKKIEELIGESMDDPYLRHNLIFSCLLLRYREQYQKEEVSLSQFERPKRRRRTSGAEPKLQG